MQYVEEVAMYKIKKYMIAISVMLVVSIVSLLVLSTLTYLFKWQADKAMIGIIVTYVLAGFAGGICLRNETQIACRRKLIEPFIVATAYMLLLLLLSCFIFQIPFRFSIQFLMIWLLIVLSSFVAMRLKSHSR